MPDVQLKGENALRHKVTFDYERRFGLVPG